MTGYRVLGPCLGPVLVPDLDSLGLRATAGVETYIS